MQNIGGYPAAAFRFPARVHFQPRSSVTVWAGCNDPLLHQPPSDFVFSEEQRWGTGPECTTILCKPNGQVLARVRVQRACACACMCVRIKKKKKKKKKMCECTCVFVYLCLCRRVCDCVCVCVHACMPACVRVRACMHECITCIMLCPTVLQIMSWMTDYALCPTGHVMDD